MYDSCVFIWTLGVSECASWVQAWGSIGTVLAGVIAVYWQLRRQRQAREAEAHEAQRFALHNARSLAATVSAVADELASMSNHRQWDKSIRVAALKGCISIAGRIDLPRLTLEQAGAVVGLMSLAAQLEYVAESREMPSGVMLEATLAHYKSQAAGHAQTLAG